MILPQLLLFLGTEELRSSHEYELDLPRFVLTLFELPSSSSDALASLFFCLAASFCLKTFRVNVLNEDPGLHLIAIQMEWRDRVDEKHRYFVSCQNCTTA